MAKKIEKMYYSMGEVAEMLDVSASTVRFWEKRFECVRPAKNRHGNRQFSPADVRNLKTIYHLVKERGMTLAGAEKVMRSGGGEGRVSGRVSGGAVVASGKAPGEAPGGGGDGAGSVDSAGGTGSTGSTGGVMSRIERDMEIAERLGAIRSLLIEVRNELSGGGVVVDNTVTEDVTIAALYHVAAPTPEPNRVTKLVSKPEPEPEPVEVEVEVAESEPESEPAPKPAPEPEPKPAPEPELAPGPEPKPAPEPVDVEVAAPDSAPKPTPKPDPGYIEQTLF